MSDGDNIYDLLRNLDLSHREAKAYFKLVQQGGGFPSSLAEQCGINRTTMYILLDELQKKGLVKRNLTRGQKYYEPLEPSTFIAEQRKKQEVIDQTLNELEIILSELTSEEEPDPNEPRAITNLEKALEYTIDRIESHITTNAAIFLVDWEQSVIRPYIFTRTNLAKFIKSKTGYIRKLSVKTSETKNLIAKCIHENKIQKSENLHLFLEPAVPKTLAEMIKKRGKIINTITVPIQINEKVIGAALLSFNKSQDKKKNMDEIMAITNEGGIKIFHSLLHERKNNLLKQAVQILSNLGKTTTQEKKKINLLLENINREITPGN